MKVDPVARDVDMALVMRVDPNFAVRLCYGLNFKEADEACDGKSDY